MVSENGAGGSLTGVNLTATDSDCGANGTITYSILDELANLYFQVKRIIIVHKTTDQVCLVNTTVLIHGLYMLPNLMTKRLTKDLYLENLTYKPLEG